MQENLLADIENYLNITWKDQATDHKISNFIRDGMMLLDKHRGAPADYTKAGLPRTLLFEYCRYARDEALDVFENNYLSLITAMRNDNLVEIYALENTQSTDP